MSAKYFLGAKAKSERKQKNGCSYAILLINDPVPLNLGFHFNKTKNPNSYKLY